MIRSLLTLAARVYVAARDFGKAEEVLRHLIEVDSANMGGYSMLGQVYLAQQKLDRGESRVREARERQSEGRIVASGGGDDSGDAEEDSRGEAEV